MWEYETWADDLDRVAIALSRQNFAFATSMLQRWISRWNASELDFRGQYLFARSIVFLGDLHRDQGSVLGPLSAHHFYTKARLLFDQLEIPRRVAQLDLSMAVVTEMTGQLEDAARRYESLADDERLSRRDRSRARLWVGTALDKRGESDYAVNAMLKAAHQFEELAEPDDWAVAQQKLALLYRRTGEQAAALRCIETARNNGSNDSPMQSVRLDVAHGHILLSDPATHDDGLRLLGRAEKLAARVGLRHQLQSVEAIRKQAVVQVLP
ncbi:hypothetical protein J4H86_16970 [Spiractinospora alimapuensis]|uniref:hypothetical protein n=1 Tax=Spiractinospora alimapuensis TaxID=2820884 RepID=UPI001F1C72B4|nr:hypothetical protein [Spiractinospora alimapuensis]QVQ50585.1 hypothetical protein J4H86_16970 [Spiractinospora alimapuensis]